MTKLEAGHDFSQFNGKKYVLEKGHIETQQKDPKIDLEHHTHIAVRIGVTEFFVDSQGYRLPFVDAAGEIIVQDGKIGFGIGTTTCKIRTDEAEAIKKVNSVAKELFGEDKVF